MKLNPDCMRDILLELEKCELNERLYLNDLCASLNQYHSDDVAYSCAKLNEAGFIKIVSKKYVHDTTVVFIEDITYQGHQFLADIRSDTVWNDVKEVSKKVGSNSLQAISQIASGVITAIINKQLGFN